MTYADMFSKVKGMMMEADVSTVNEHLAYQFIVTGEAEGIVYAEVKEGIEQAHFETYHIQYNDENALSYTISLALYSARNYYTVYREFPSGKGFADMVYLPRKKFMDKPALVVELKWDKSAQGAVAQIKNKQYCKSLQEYEGNILLVGINYDKDTREHECIIEDCSK